MRKGITITNDHGWTIEQLQTQEKTIKKASMAKRVAIIRLVMQGYYAIQVAVLLNVHRETKHGGKSKHRGISHEQSMCSCCKRPYKRNCLQSFLYGTNCEA